jgi:hypothetical protein
MWYFTPVNIGIVLVKPLIEFPTLLIVGSPMAIQIYIVESNTKSLHGLVSTPKIPHTITSMTSNRRKLNIVI